MLKDLLCGLDLMSKSKNKSTSSSDVSSEKPPITIEEIDCERRGYKLTHKTLGTGAYAKVKLAYVSDNKKAKHPFLRTDLENKNDNKIAIKIISKKNAPAEYLEKFMPREIDALNATCRHRNVITLYETFRSETKIYLVMEYAAKGDLLEFINSRTRRGQPLTEEKAKILFRQLVLGITHCHQRNVVHRDLKCENVLLDANDLIKVTDFGFATRYPTSKCKFLDTFCGSYAYAAPEILSACKYDGKLADIWSLGVILFAMTCGRLPYNDKSLKHLIEQTKKKVIFPEKLNLSSELRDLIHGILVHDSTSRLTLHEILFHPWLAMTKVPKQAPSCTPSRKLSRGDREYEKPTPCITGTGTIALERRTRPLGVPRPQKKARRPSVPSPVQFLVATQRENSIRKSAIPSGTWSPQSSTPEPGHVAKMMRDKNNNDVMKLLMAAGPERPATPIRLYKLAPERHQKVINAYQAPTSSPVARPRTGASRQGNHGDKMTSVARDGGNRYASMKSGVFLRTVHTLYRCKKAEDEITESWKEETAVDGQGQPADMEYSGSSDKYNFPPVSGRAGSDEKCPQHQRASSCRRYSAWRRPVNSSRKRNLAIISRNGKTPNSRTSHSAGYDGNRERRDTNSCCRKTFASVSQPKQLVSKLTVHVIK
ncbi:testis-specific serine/threonine-protein kinase 1-like [Dendronephthya gigantea]|uniref:testis-specific serine/threonine-protein kinase 1-like n=1 Tax=Dendronephthya gigantea TaxID=151771 RepID=UPI00106A84B4|nr:testis-specific serine/threonine-protein kinase 1-like [Dendronephthya gigantea]XP_028396472.1 testis-specific serine/threonine-protein kinase 1-like [Dendronephthya gigantea]